MEPDDAPPHVSGEQDRGQSPPRRKSRWVRRTPGFKELHELLARGVLVPGPVAAHDFEKLIGRFRSIAASVQRQRKIESSLMIERVGLDPALEIRGVSERSRLLGQF